MFSKILIANRGEIAGADHQDLPADGGSPPWWSIPRPMPGPLPSRWPTKRCSSGPAPAAQSYLLGDRIIAAASETGAQAIHPGFGFLSEKMRDLRGFAPSPAWCSSARNPDAIDAMGDKIQSKRFATAAKVTVVPGHVGEIDDVARAGAVSEDIGYPVMIKASAGGGRQGHPRRLEPPRCRGGLCRRPGGGQGRVRRRPNLHREVSSRAHATSRSRSLATSTAM